MKRCTECDREYLDSYQDCPFCSRDVTRDTAAESGASDSIPQRSRMYAAIGWGSLIIVLSAVAVYMVLSMNSRSDDQATGLSALEQCFENQEAIEKAAANQNAQTGDESPDARALLPVYLERIPACPEEGEYSITWTAKIPKCECTIHPWHGDSQ